MVAARASSRPAPSTSTRAAAICACPSTTRPGTRCLASMSQAYLAYCDCVRRKDQEKRSIVAAVTGGGTDNLMVGRNGVFYDRKGDDWARRSRSWSRTRSASARRSGVRTSASSASSRSSSRSAPRRPTRSRTRSSRSPRSTAGPADKKPEAPAAEAQKPPAKGIDIGTVAAIGVAVGGIATFFSSILATFFGLGMWMPLGLLAALLAISGPSMLVAYLKLRQRNIGPILDANGWAVNAMASINVPFGRAHGRRHATPGSCAHAARSLRREATPLAPLWLRCGGHPARRSMVLGKLDTYLPDRGKAEPCCIARPCPSPRRRRPQSRERRGDAKGEEAPAAHVVHAEP